VWLRGINLARQRQEIASNGSSDNRYKDGANLLCVLQVWCFQPSSVNGTYLKSWWLLCWSAFSTPGDLEVLSYDQILR
jgi:hypothetical protein